MSTANKIVGGFSFTPNELEVIKLLAKGYSRKEIASAMHKSPTTVHSYVQVIFRITGFGKNTSVVYWASKQDLDHPGTSASSDADTPPPPPAPGTGKKKGKKRGRDASK